MGLEGRCLMMRYDFQARSCSSGKQRRTRLPSSFMEKDIVPKPIFTAEGKSGNSVKPRSPSPPVRRSVSTDRGAVIRTKMKSDTVDNQPIARVPFPARVPVSRSMVVTSICPSTDNNVNLQEHPKKENVFDTLCSFQKVSTRKVHPENEEDHFKLALSVRQGSIRKSKIETKAKAKHQPSARIENYEAAGTLLPNINAGEKVEEGRKSDFSEPENEHLLMGSLMNGGLRIKKHEPSLKSSQISEER